jgi:hypothetical protein
MVTAFPGIDLLVEHTACGNAGQRVSRQLHRSAGNFRTLDAAA